MSSPEVAGLTKRCIVHLDLDAFYAQVEMKRKNVPEGTPLAVQQWDGLIAVNYAARARGVTRHMRTAQALEACPDLMLVHVQTIGSGGAAVASEEGSADARWNTKACLQRYRAASGCIMRVLKEQLTHGALMEKAGLDEVFVDVTPMVEAECKRMRSGSIADAAPGASHAIASHSHSHSHSGPGPHTAEDASHAREARAACGSHASSGSHGALEDLEHASDEYQEEGQAGENGHMDDQMGGQMDALRDLAEAVRGHTIIEGDVQLDLELEADQRLLVAASIAKRLRDAVLQDASCGYTCSAGIGPNKLVAKIGSARNKPNKQTLLLPRAVPGLMQSLPIGKLRWLGGKMGAALNQALGATTAGDVQAASVQELGRIVGDKAWWLYNYVRGVDDEAVKPKGPIKSLNSCKQFNATNSMEEIARWMSMLAYELAERMADDEWEHHRRPRNLTLGYRRGRSAVPTQERSVRCAMPSHSASTGPSPDAIAAAAMTLFRKLPDALPCVRLALSATDFFQPPAEGARAITHFLAPQQPTQAANHLPTTQPPPRPRPKPGTITQFLAPQPSTIVLAPPTQQPVAGTVGQPTITHQEPTSQPTNQPAIQPISQPTNQPINQPTNQPAIRPVNQPTNQSSNQPTNQPTNQPSNQPNTHRYPAGIREEGDLTNSNILPVQGFTEQQSLLSTGIDSHDPSADSSPGHRRAAAVPGQSGVEPTCQDGHVQEITKLEQDSPMPDFNPGPPVQAGPSRLSLALRGLFRPPTGSKQPASPPPPWQLVQQSAALGQPLLPLPHQAAMIHQAPVAGLGQARELARSGMAGVEQAMRAPVERPGEGQTVERSQPEMAGAQQARAGPPEQSVEGGVSYGDDQTSDAQDAWMQGIDIEEQRRMLQEMERRPGQSRQQGPSGGRPASLPAGRGTGGGQGKRTQQQQQRDGKKQLSIAAMFRKA